MWKGERENGGKRRLVVDGKEGDEERNEERGDWNRRQRDDSKREMKGGREVYTERFSTRGKERKGKVE